MDCRANSDMLFLPDEKFDFDVSLSPASSKGDESEDEVFVGPVSHKEKCVSVNVVSRLEDCGHSVRTSWSPLTGDQLEAVCQEAHRLADQLQNGELSQPPGGGVREDDDKTPNVTTSNKEVFVQDADAKLGVLDQAATVLSPIKRQTFCVQDSPMKQLPPAVQRRLLKGSSSSTAPPARHSSASTNSLIRPVASTRLSTSSPVAVAKTQNRTGLRGRTSMGVAAVLPSKPSAPTASCSSSKTRVERTRLQPPSKSAVGRRRSPASHPTRRAESSEDLLSDSASVASDVSDCSLNSSLQGKRSLAPPTKTGLKTATGVKAPALQSRRMTDRKNTSSSSSSVSSFNSSLSLSPAKGKLNSSLNRSVSSSAVPAPSSVGKPANGVKPRRSTVYGTVEPPSSSSSSSSTSTAASRRSVSVQARKPSEVERVKTGRSTPLKRSEATPLQVTPAKRGAPDRKASIPSAAPSSARQSGLKPKNKPEAPVAPTPSGAVRGVSNGDDASKMMKPKRLMSASSVDSLPLTPSAGGCKSLQLKTRRPSALPTPVRRRASALPVATPVNNKPRLARPPPTCDSDPAPSSASVSRDRSCSPAPAGVQEVEPADAAPEIQPFCLEEEEEEEQKEREEPAADAPPTTTSPTQPDQSESTAPEAPSQVESAQPIKNLIELETVEESNRTAQEVLLLDLPAPTLPPQEKLLIDLTNTPNLIRNSNKSCTGAQLIDLSSPLIKWSPEDKRENNAPLINLSF